MKAESDVRPSRFLIDVRGDRAIVSFFDNVEEFTDDEGNIKYKYDYYTLELTNRDGLYDEIENNYEEYLELAKSS